MISAIVSVDTNFVIGVNGHLPWHCKEDLMYFKKLTTGKVVIMGRNTYESLPKGALPERSNYVVTSKPIDDPNIKCFDSLQKAIEAAESDKIYKWIPKAKREIFIIGGQRLYEEALDRYLIDKLYISYIDTTVDTSECAYYSTFPIESVLKNKNIIVSTASFCPLAKANEAIDNSDLIALLKAVTKVANKQKNTDKNLLAGFVVIMGLIGVIAIIAIPFFMFKPHISNTTPHHHLEVKRL